eukprot:XP_004915713.1 PREDICTED: uncharacterized protein LOC101734734 [Xenopus tropicalis]
MKIFIEPKAAAGNLSTIFETSGLENQFPEGINILLIILISFLISLIVLGNSIVMLAFIMDKRLRNQSNFFLLNLAICDFFVGAITIPMYMPYLFTGKWMLGGFLCKLWLTVDYTTSTASAYSVALISYDRFLSVTQAVLHRSLQKRHRQTVFKMTLVWVFPFLIYGPTIIFWEIITGTNNVPQYSCRAGFLGTWYFLIGASSLDFVFPMISISFLNLRIYWNIQKRNRKKRKSSSCQTSKEKTTDGSPYIVATNIILSSPQESRRKGRQKEEESKSSVNKRDNVSFTQNLNIPNKSNVLVMALNRDKKVAKSLAILVSIFALCWAPYSFLVSIRAACQGYCVGSLCGLENQFQEGVNILLLILISFLVLLIVLGNSIVMLAFIMDKRLRNQSNFFLLNLAICDFFVGAITIPMYMPYIFTGKWMLGRFLCKLWLTVDYTTSTASAYSVALISYDRFLSVTQAVLHRSVQKRHRQTVFKMALVWIISFLIYGPAIIFWEIITGTNNVPHCTCCAGFLGTWYFLIGASSLDFIFPMISILFLNSRIYWNIQKRNRKKRKSSSCQTLEEKETVGSPYIIATNIILSYSQASRRKGKMVEEESKSPVNKRHNVSFTQSFNIPNKGNVLVMALNRDKKVAKSLAILVSIFALCWAPYSFLVSIRAACQGYCVGSLWYYYQGLLGLYWVELSTKEEAEFRQARIVQRVVSGRLKSLQAQVSSGSKQRSQNQERRSGTRRSVRKSNLECNKSPIFGH